MTTNVVSTIVKAGIPLLIIDTAMNWELPAKTISDIKPMASGCKPAFCPRTPKAIPMGKYPKQTGHAAARPRRNTDEDGDRCMELSCLMISG